MTSAAFSSSPIIDFTGYRQSETTEPTNWEDDIRLLLYSGEVYSGFDNAEIED